MDNGAKKVLVCPLGWGLGHASRDIPIIDHFLKLGCEVLVAGDSQQLSLLNQRFPGVKSILFPSFKVKFSKRKSQLWPLTRITFILPFHIIKEHFSLKQLIREHQIDIVVSDNRYGLWNRHVKTILITHQLKVFFPKPFRFLEPVGELFIKYFIKKFDECWVPDLLGNENLAGELSHPSVKIDNVKYIGVLSRFSNYEVDKSLEAFDLIGIASGPSPQREMFIDEVAKLARRHLLKTLIMKGEPELGTIIHEVDGIKYVGHLEDYRFASYVKSAKHVICRAGYSTIMDMVALDVKPLIVPTPGQTEQEYLAKYLDGKGIFRFIEQNKIETIDIDDFAYRGSSLDNSAIPLNSFVEQFLETHLLVEKM